MTTKFSDEIVRFEYSFFFCFSLKNFIFIVKVIDMIDEQRIYSIGILIKNPSKFSKWKSISEGIIIFFSIKRKYKKPFTAILV